jgi:hypothetical protein
MVYMERSRRQHILRASWQQQTPQQWVTVDYNAITERLTLLRAALGVVAGLLGIIASWDREVEAKVLFHAHAMKKRIFADDNRTQRLARIVQTPFMSPQSLSLA